MNLGLLYAHVANVIVTLIAPEKACSELLFSEGNFADITVYGIAPHGNILLGQVDLPLENVLFRTSWTLCAQVSITALQTTRKAFSFLWEVLLAVSTFHDLPYISSDVLQSFQACRVNDDFMFSSTDQWIRCQVKVYCVQFFISDDFIANFLHLSLKAVIGYQMLHLRKFHHFKLLKDFLHDFLRHFICKEAWKDITYFFSLFLDTSLFLQIEGFNLLLESKPPCLIFFNLFGGHICVAAQWFVVRDQA